MHFGLGGFVLVIAVSLQIDEDLLEVLLVAHQTGTVDYGIRHMMGYGTFVFG